MQFSAYEQINDAVWVGTHRLPLNMAVNYCKELHDRRRCKVALVPDNVDPQPYFQFVQTLA